ncbi:hypothetical protein FOFC_10029 [Fusarium oxysporum]|nr:hypothetical protein FOFC_10029 [Fusarium oxysporum]
MTNCRQLRYFSIFEAASSQQPAIGNYHCGCG